MLQRPQTLLFIAAAILAVLAAFAPIATYSPGTENAPARVQKRMKELHPEIIVKASDMDFHMNYVKDLHGKQSRYTKDLQDANEQMDKEVAKRQISIVFNFGLVGCLILAVCIGILVFLFKNRKLQIRLGVVLFLVSLAVTTGIFIASKIALEIFAELDIIPVRLAEMDWEIGYSYGFFLFPVIAVFLLVGVLLVRRDDNLVKSLDRLR